MKLFSKKNRRSPARDQTSSNPSNESFNMAPVTASSYPRSAYNGAYVKGNNGKPINRQASDFSDQMTATSSVFMSNSVYRRPSPNNVQVYSNQKFNVGKPVFVSPDDVAVLRPEDGMKVIEAGGYGKSRQRNENVAKNDIWIDLKLNATSAGFHGRAPRDAVVQRKQKRSSAPPSSTTLKNNAAEAARVVAKDVSPSPTNVSDGVTRRKQVASLKKKLHIAKNNEDSKAYASMTVARNKVSSPEWSPPKQGHGAKDSHVPSLSVSPCELKNNVRLKTNSVTRCNNGLPPSTTNAKYQTSPTLSRNSRHVEKRISLGVMSAISSLSSMDSLPDLHDDLSNAQWEDFHSHLTILATNSELILPALTATDADFCTPLHIAVWKAPPSSALLLIALLNKASVEISSGLLLSRDNGGNTPIHYCAGNGTDDSIGIIAALIKAAPRALSIQNAEGDTPLHLAVSCSTVSIECISLLLDACPEAVLTQDCSGGTPLHSAIANGAKEKIIMKLLQFSPRVASIVDNDGLLPLHYVAAFVDTSVKAVEELIKAYPEGVVQESNDGDVPLHTAIVNCGDNLDARAYEIIDMLSNPYLKKEPILMTNKEKSNPLHCCAIFDVSCALIEHLMKFPSSLKASCVVNGSGMTPLHIAAAHSSVAKSVVPITLLGNKDAAIIEDPLKGTPMHVACQNVHATGALIDAIAALNPSALSMETQRGHLPLHIAAQSPCPCSDSVVRALLKHYSIATKKRNKSGNLPLHDAAKYRASLKVIKVLIEADPDALYSQNSYGNLALHYCATAHESTDIVELLLEKWSEGASIQNCNLDTPLHYAATTDATLDMVRLLSNATPSSLLLRNKAGQTPLERAQANNAPHDVIEFLEEITEDWTLKASSEGWGATFDDSIPNDTAAEF